MKTYIKYFLGAWIIISSSYASDRTPSLISEILTQETPEDASRPHVVFDIDETFLVRDSMADQNQEKILARFPDSLVMPYRHSEAGDFNFIAYPGMMEVFLILLQRGWNIDFFSSGIDDRNVKMVEGYLTYMLARYTATPEKDLKDLMVTRIRVIPQKQIIDEREFKGERRNPHGYDSASGDKKDLSKLGVPLKHIVLVDDDRGWVPGDQYPLLDATLPEHQKDYYKGLNDGRDTERGDDVKMFGHRMEWDSKLKKLVPSKRTYDEMHYPFADYAAFYAGVFGKCHDLMIAGEKLSLRAALSKVLKREDYDPPQKRYPGDVETPWHLFRSGETLPESLYVRWLERGRSDIANINTHRREDYVAPADPFKDIEIMLYGEGTDLATSGSE